MLLFDEMARQRGWVYRWFSQLLFQELTDEALAHLRDSDNQALVNALKLIPRLSLPACDFQCQLSSALKRPNCQQELAADYASLFLVPPPEGISPYAGHYPHTTSAEVRQVMRRLLVCYELAPQNNEAVDHISIQLALMSTLAEKSIHSKEGLEQQRLFLQQQLLIWLPLFSDRCYQCDSFGFYASVLRLLMGFIYEDVKWVDAYLHHTNELKTD